MGFKVDMSPLTQSGVNQANMLQGLGQTIGGTLGGVNRRNEQQAKDEKMQQLMQAAASGDPQAIDTLYSIDPTIGKQMEDRMFAGQDRQVDQRAMDTSDLIEKMAFASPDMQERMFNAAVPDDRFDIDEGDREVFMNPKNQWAAIAKARGEDYANDFFSKDGGSKGLPAETVAFNDLIKDFTPKEQALAKRVKAGLKGRAVTNAIITGIKDGTIETYTDAMAEIEGAKEQSKLTSQLEVKPKIVEAEEEVKISADLRKQTQKQNSQRLSELTRSEKSRASTTKKAARFLKAFKSSAQSGASRSALSFLPGVFTDQAQFDEQFNAFAEVAARAKLKEAGETRPTDADVEGMKRAIFGVGRDEATNIILLEEFISDQSNSDIELDELRDAKKMGALDTFTGAIDRSEADILAEYGIE